jgi:polyhydroxybutyrate depolymerase
VRCAPWVVLAVVVAGCGGSSSARRETRHDAPAPAAAPARASRCTDHLPLGAVVDVPRGPRVARPLILALHGAGQGGPGMQRYTGLSEDAHGFVVAYPSTPHRSGFWKPADVPRLLGLVDAIARCVPISGVSAVGFSNGGLMANALACRAADRVRAIVTVASGYLGLGRCTPSRPVSVFDIHGTSDPVVGYGGLRAFVGTWARRDRCSPRPTVAHGVDGWPITHLRWHGCAGGVRMEHLRVSGDTHGWPSLEDANQRIVAFLRRAGA